MLFSDRIDIANHFGHRAVESLSIAHQAWQQASATYAANENTHWTSLAAIGIELNQLRKREFEFCADSIIFFQAMMEAIINQVIIEHPKLKPKSKRPNFAEKWENAFDTHSLGRADLDAYVDFYRSHRNPLIHPKTRDKVENIEVFRFPTVYEGLQAGWSAFNDLFQVLGTPHDPNSWKTMCKTHNLPDKIDPKQYVDIMVWSGEMMKRHQDGANGIS